MGITYDFFISAPDRSLREVGEEMATVLGAEFREGVSPSGEDAVEVTVETEGHTLPITFIVNDGDHADYISQDGEVVPLNDYRYEGFASLDFEQDTQELRDDVQVIVLRLAQRFPIVSIYDMDTVLVRSGPGEPAEFTDVPLKGERVLASDSYAFAKAEAERRGMGIR